ncbi:hypothetical protein F5I97DRAFT_1929800 [Phlebopus sp. FC_14]|nr:hypothetical protein F5I97DRAFT_1929800 [Phlebopus sp. FC_14]
MIAVVFDKVKASPLHHDLVQLSSAPSKQRERYSQLSRSSRYQYPDTDMVWRLPNIPTPQDSSSDTLSHAVQDLREIYPINFNVHKYLYLPHGKFAFTSTHIFKCGRETYTWSHNKNGSFLAFTRGQIAGHLLTCMIKTWDIQQSWKTFFVELYVLSHPKLLRWLQGDFIPHVIGVFSSGDGRMSIVMETPHHTGWYTAHPDMPAHVKEAVVYAFETIHAQGVMHGDISNQNILIGDDGTVTIVNFGKCACLPDFDLSVHLSTCTRLDLEKEMRAVKYCIGYRDAKLREQTLLDTSEGANCCDFVTPLHVEEMNRWNRESEGHSATHFSVPRRLRGRPILNDRRPHNRTASTGQAATPCNGKEPVHQLSSQSTGHHSTPSGPIDPGVQPHENVHPSKQALPGGGVESPSGAGSSTTSRPSDNPSATDSTPGPSISMTNPHGPISSTSDTCTRRSPESFLEYTPAQIHFALKRKRETDDEGYLEASRNVRRRPGVDAEKKGVVFHPGTHDNGLWSTGEEPMHTGLLKFTPSELEGRMHVNFDKMHWHCKRYVNKVTADKRRRMVVKTRGETTRAEFPPLPRPSTREKVIAASDGPSGLCSGAILPIDEPQVKGGKRKRPSQSVSTYLPNQHPPKVGDDGARYTWRPWPRTYALLNACLAHLPFGRNSGLAMETSNAAPSRKRKLNDLEHSEPQAAKRPRRDST